MKTSVIVLLGTAATVAGISFANRRSKATNHQVEHVRADMAWNDFQKKHSDAPDQARAGPRRPPRERVWRSGGAAFELVYKTKIRPTSIPDHCAPRPAKRRPVPPSTLGWAWPSGCAALALQKDPEAPWSHNSRA
eukprot:CAMPEP_0206283106 /NCGR_PEP_ID=MMETSP0047_2-20121206/40043_1 /ASSEMBLY_ACC=CAM_ASM_000192 /TAXON_ID=195065 /ORGANISM="Chroomonas mesostigmatica_cf, Strain CCMP1168" /LENGTH=134 /DNA_ID=CAMNT_0053713429 /DNA_START=84 /DNA_END=486 /DNA_ORIENTATION=+